jgi:hypothetical protein
LSSCTNFIMILDNFDLPRLKMAYFMSIRKVNSNRKQISFLTTISLILLGIYFYIQFYNPILPLRRLPTFNNIANPPEAFYLEENITTQKLITKTSLVELNENYEREFDRVLTQSCNPRDINDAKFTCLSVLNDLDTRYKRLKAQLPNYHASHECTTTAQAGPSKLLFHSFWKIEQGGVLMNSASSAAYFSMRMLKLNVMSFLSTQNLHCSKLIIWTLPSFSATYRAQIETLFGEYFRRDVIGMETFDLANMCAMANGSNFGKSGICLKNLNAWLAFKSSVSISDLGNVNEHYKLMKF